MAARTSMDISEAEERRRSLEIWRVSIGTFSGRLCDLYRILEEMLLDFISLLFGVVLWWLWAVVVVSAGHVCQHALLYC